MRTVAELTENYVDILADTFPVTATSFGRHELDGSLGVYSAEIYDEFAGDLAGMRAELHTFVDLTIGGAADPEHLLEARALDGLLATALLEDAPAHFV